MTIILTLPQLWAIFAFGGFLITTFIALRLLKQGKY